MMLDSSTFNNSNFKRSFDILLNRNFKKKLVFRLGANAGFFSEFNNMVFAILYCLENNIQFRLSSSNSNFSIDKGWQDYFLPFCKEEDESFYTHHSVRPYQLDIYKNSKKWKIRHQIFKVLNPNIYLTQELWHLFHNKVFINKKIFIKDLEINNEFLYVAKAVIDSIWNYQPNVQREVDTVINRLNLPASFVGLHIRSGDKVQEHRLYTVDTYINKLKEISDQKNVFVATDDYKNVQDLRIKYPQYNFYTLCQPSAGGHLQSDFDHKKGETKRRMMLDLFSDIEILKKSEKFIGTYSSNIGMFLGMALGESRCYCLDFQSWKFWSTNDF